MINAYCNMSAPPLSRVQKVVRPVGKLLVFGFSCAGLQVPGDAPGQPDTVRDARIQDWLADFVRQHAAALDAVARPAGFMIGTAFADAGMPLGGGRTASDVAAFCRDPVLTVAVLGRMSGRIYIPRRELGLTCHGVGYADRVAFPAKYFQDLQHPAVRT